VGRGLDDRVGAFVVLEAARILSKGKPKAEIHAVGTVQEEIGLRGATTSTYGIDPHVGIAIDVTFATDHPMMSDTIKQGEVEIGGGPVIIRGANINQKIFELLVDTAKKEKIPYQINAEPRGTGTDANAMQLSRSGVAMGLISIPNRYMHSPCELVSLKDLDNCALLMAKTAERITAKTNLIPF
jgi:endoglucanase